jgi:hypothetical protein
LRWPSSKLTPADLYRRSNRGRNTRFSDDEEQDNERSADRERSIAGLSLEDAENDGGIFGGTRHVRD